MIIGIDPGKKGAIVCIDGDEIEATPMIDDIGDFADFIRMKHRIMRTVVVIEKSHSMPGQSSVAMFNYGKHFGELIGVIRTLQIPLHLVAPQKWQKEMFHGSTGATPKEKALKSAKRLFPHVNLVPPRCKVAHQGIVDALLIAEYGRRYLT